MGFLLLTSSSKRIIKNAEDQLLHSGKLIEVQLQEYIDELITDQMFLSGNPVLKNYLKAQSTENYTLLNKEFLSLIIANSDYGQIRFLDGETGKELVRVDRMNGKPVIIPSDQLQVKKNRPYFTNTIQLDSNELYFSAIDLNKEFGKISKPYTPTLRIAKPIYYKGVNRGIIVINTNLTKLFDKLNKSVGADFDLRVFNEDGYYLLHEKKDSTFTFEFGAKSPQVRWDSKSIPGGIQRTDNELFSSHMVSNPQIGYNIYYHIIANKSALLSAYYEWIKQSIYRILLIAFIFTGIAFFTLRSQFKNLQKLTASIKEFAVNRSVSSLPKKRNDEIGELAKSFEEMAEIINNQITSIESEKRKAELAEKDKSNFIENITHEIRNPLQSIIGLSTILEQNNPNSNQIEILNSIRLNTTNLNALVNSILDYQNILKDNLKLQRQYTDLIGLIQELVMGVSYTANQKGIKIQTTIDDNLKFIEVNIDRLRISQILNNLLTNAIAHTKTNGVISIEIHLSKLVSDEGKSTMRFQVSDNGIGMSQAEIERITERYYTKSKDFVSTNYGLGLTIINELLSMMNSQLVVKSKQNAGSTFSFEILTKTRKKIKSETSLDIRDNSLKGKKIIVLEDDEQVVNLYRYYFEDVDVDFHSSFDILQQKTNEQYDLVITDFYLQSANLEDHLDALQNTISKSTALIVVSGQELNTKQIKNKFPEAVFIQKPISKETFFRGIITATTYTRFGVPYTSSVKKDYDNDASKYMKAFDLLMKEWQIYTDRLIENIRNRNVEELEEVLHKLNNTLRRLHLFQFEEYLFQIKEGLNSSSFDAESASEKIAEIMSIYYDDLASSLN